MPNFKPIEKIADINSKHRLLFERISIILIFISISTTLYSKIIIYNNFKINVLVGTTMLGILELSNICDKKPSGLNSCYTSNKFFYHFIWCLKS